ncbi:M20/M25/M40 family metallo-hydrolase [Pontibacter sp. 172403-2]|uniref:M28 family peptidase n=1 Tax=Pontibacter rufus TaxID=2791028 RepID=UPI0018AFDEBB|nr:M28 family peptidase [Pontibacter sp. 172403-2]MBF9251734.1 M20/M25/M40 family metallo-hydrolase [Pontibacter sp. 172403-2]
MRNRSNVLAAFLLITLTGLAWLSLYLLQPPEAKPTDAPATEFSAARAMRYVRQIAQAPHAMGTTAHAKVRGYLVGQMQELGLHPQVQETNVVNNVGAVSYVGHVYNIIGRLDGSGGDEQAILLMAHYDSQPNALGAGDDGAGVAALLETARALQQGAPLQHDVIFLLTDGEEYGLYGAQGFLKHPWAKQVALVLNLEARGNSGPSMTFEMNPENGWIARQFAEAAPYPFVSSLAYEIYSRMPNDTDFTVFKEAGYSGLNSAFIDGLMHYHKLTDSPENLNQNSLQQHGSNLLALTRHFGNISLAHTKAPDAVFFNFIDGWVINYKKDLNILWLALTTLLLVVTFIVGKRRTALTVWQVAGGFFLYLLMLVIVVGLFIPVNNMVLGLLPYSHPFNGVLYSANAFFIAYLLLALGLFLLLSRVALRWLRLFSLLMGVFILWFVLLLALFLAAPAAGYLLMFPLLFALGGVLVVFLLDLHQKPKSPGYSMVLLLSVVPAVFLLMPIVQVVFVAFSLQLSVAMVALFVLLLGLLLPLLATIGRGFNWRGLPVPALVLLLLGSIEVALAAAHEKPTPERPLHSHISYFLNADTNKALWISAFRKTDDWNRQFFPNPAMGTLKELYSMAGIPYLKNEAKALPLAVPVAEVVQDITAGDTRVLRLHLSSPRGAAHLEMVLQPENATDLVSAEVNGEPLSLQPSSTEEGPAYFVRLHGLPPSKDAMLVLRLKAGGNIRLLLYDQTIGLPQELIKQPKPAYIIPEQGRDNNLTVVRKSYTF